MVRQGFLERVVSWFAAPVALNPLDDRYYETSGGSLSRSGVRVNADTAMHIATVYRCVSILANTLAMFGMEMYEKLERGRKEAPDHPLNSLVSFAPNKRQTAFEFWRLVCFHLTLRQNAYVQIVQGPPGRGWVGQLVPLHPDRIRGPEELPDGRLRYEYQRPDGTKVRMIGGVDIWHLTGLSSDGLKGLSILDVAAESFGVSLAAEGHSANFLGRGVNFAGLLQSERTYKPEVAAAMSESFSRTYGGSAGAGKIPVLWEGMEFKPISMTMKDAEFLDSRKFSVTEIARWFGLPPHLISDVERSTSWGTGIAEQNLAFLIYSLQPWITLLEQSVRFTLVVQPEKFYPKMNSGKLLRMDASAQAGVFATLIDKGVLSPNECRELLERNPRDGGDEYVDVSKPEPPPAPPRMPPPDTPQDAGEAAPVLVLEPPVSDPVPDPEPLNRATEVAKRRVEELLHEENEALGKMAKAHAKDTSGWRSAVAHFYGRFGPRIANTGVCDLTEAKSWCVSRRDLVLTDGGLHLLTTDHPTAQLGGLHAG